MAEGNHQWFVIVCSGWFIWQFWWKKILDDDDIHNYDNIGELSNETDHNNGSNFDQYSDTNDLVLKYFLEMWLSVLLRISGQSRTANQDWNG